MKLDEYIIVQKQRIFIDICIRGCGSGCAYCYVQSKGQKQELLSLNQIKSVCEIIKSKYDCHNRIISLCPNTEPLKTDESINLVLYIARFFIALGAYIQISTKERIPEYFFKEINSIAEGKIYLNISIPYLINTEKIEPNAGSVKDRLQNFIEIQKYSNLNICLYIKPFNSSSIDMQYEYINMIKFYDIKMVCVGVEFDKSGEMPCQSLYNEDQAKRLFEQQHSNIDSFIGKIRSCTSAKVYGSSICCIHNDFFEQCSLRLFKYDEVVCQDCVLWDYKLSKIPLSLRDN